MQNISSFIDSIISLKYLDNLKKTFSKMSLDFHNILSHNLITD